MNIFEWQTAGGKNEIEEYFNKTTQKELIGMPFIKSDPNKTEIELERLAQTDDGARAIHNFDLMIEFRKKLIEARKQVHLSQAEIAKRSGLKQQAISRLEKGYQDRSVTLPTLLRYVDALGLSLSLQEKVGDYTV